MAEKKKSEKTKSESSNKTENSAKSEAPDSPTPLGEIDQGPSKFEQFLENNQKKLLMLTVAVVLGVSGWIVIKGMRETKETNAGQAIVAAQDMGDYRNVIEKFSGTPAAGTAQLLLAKEQWADQLQDEAIETLRKFIADQPKHSARPSARMALASYLLEREETEEGTSILKELTTDENSKHLAPLALIRLGDLESAAGQEDAAREFYTQAKEFGEVSVLTERLASSRLNALGVSLPVTVPRPKPPAPPIRPPLLPPGAPDNTAPETPAALPPGIPGIPAGTPLSPPVAVPTPGAPTPLPPTVPVPTPQPTTPKPEPSSPAPTPGATSPPPADPPENGGTEPPAPESTEPAPEPTEPAPEPAPQPSPGPEPENP